MNGRRARAIRRDAQLYARGLNNVSVKTIARRMRRTWTRSRRYGR